MMTRQRSKSRKPRIWTGILWSLTGLCGMGYALLQTKMCLMLTEDFRKDDLVSLQYTVLMEAVIFGLMFLLFGVIFVKGIARLRRLILFGKVQKQMNGREMISLQELASALGISSEKARKQITKMIQSGYFPQGHLNRESTCFLTTDRAYSAYQNVLEEWRKEEEKWKRDGMTEDKRQTLKQAEECAKRIGQRIDNVQEQKIKEELQTLKASVERLLEVLTYEPENIYILRTFLNYYLPMTEKLLNEYERLPDYDGGKNLTELRQEIAEGIRTLGKAFVQITERLCSQSEVRITEEIGLLEILMKQKSMEEKQRSA